MKIGKPVFKAMAKDEPDFIGSDCPMAGHHIAQGMQQAGTPAKAVAAPAEPAAHRLRNRLTMTGDTITIATAC
jgi:hypothetical protein